jgi:hypothetical protein
VVQHCNVQECLGLELVWMIPLLPNIYVDRFEKKTYMLIGVKKKSKLFFFLLMPLSLF